MLTRDKLQHSQHQSRQVDNRWFIEPLQLLTRIVGDPSDVDFNLVPPLTLSFPSFCLLCLFWCFLVVPVQQANVGVRKFSKPLSLLLNIVSSNLIQLSSRSKAWALLPVSFDRLALRFVVSTVVNCVLFCQPKCISLYSFSFILLFPF